MKKTISNQKTIIWLLLVLVASPYIIYLVPQYLGVDAYIVSSGSMAPEMPTGTIVYENWVSPQELEEGDVIVFRPNRSEMDKDVITHRIIDVREGNYTNHFKTQGDANSAPDPGWTPGYRVIGKRVFSIPYLGYFIMAAGSLPFLFLLVFIPATFLTYTEARKIIENWDKKKSGEKEQNRRIRVIREENPKE